MILIFDIGRTNKKFILFDQNYKVVEERSVPIPDIEDEDGNVCEDLKAITTWMKQCLADALDKKYDIRAINFSTHGASFVHLDRDGGPVTPLYDYLKPVDRSLHREFYGLFGGEKSFSLATGSPALDMLNSGMQLFWLKKRKRDFFSKINTSLHLPQYANYIFTGKKHADITSIGCHTGLWDFEKAQYHSWIYDEELHNLLPERENPDVADKIVVDNKEIPVGIGLHDSSAALLPFVYTADQPFVLLSTGTWNITLNPYYQGALSGENYEKDCLYFLLDINRKVAASRLFLGNEYQYQIKRLSEKFHKPASYHMNLKTDKELLVKVIDQQSAETFFYPSTMKGTGPFPGVTDRESDLSRFCSYEEAYHKLMLDMAAFQKVSIGLVSGNINRLYVSGGFAMNAIFMELLQAFLPGWQIHIAENPRASALGAAVAMHRAWSDEPLSKAVCPIVPYKSEVAIDVTNYRFLLEEEATKREIKSDR